MEDLIPIIAILSSVALPIGFGMYLGLVAIKSKHRENIELVKQGIIPPPQTKGTPNKYRSLRNGFLCLGIGIGAAVGFILQQVCLIDVSYHFFVFAASILIFLGIAYIAFFLVTKDKNLDE